MKPAICIQTLSLYCVWLVRSSSDKFLPLCRRHNEYDVRGSSSVKFLPICRSHNEYDVRRPRIGLLIPLFFIETVFLWNTDDDDDKTTCAIH